MAGRDMNLYSCCEWVLLERVGVRRLRVMQTRRQLIVGALPVEAGAVVAPYAVARGLTSRRRAPLFDRGTFEEGVMAGDPAPNAITLWTRLGDVGGSGAVALEVAADPGFRHVIRRASVATDDGLGHAAHARVKGLKPYEEYYYRFSTATTDSPVGRFRTALPPGSR